MVDLKGIPGTPVFTGEQAQIGYALNKMCFAFNDEAMRRAFVADENAVMDQFHLTPKQRDAIRARNVNALLDAGGNIYYLAKFAGIFGLSVQDIGAQQTGMSLSNFKQHLVEQAQPAKAAQ